MFIKYLFICKQHFLFPTVGLEGAAFQSRVHADKLTTLEGSLFADISAAPSTTHKIFLYIRNRIVSDIALTKQIQSFISWFLIFKLNQTFE